MNENEAPKYTFEEAYKMVVHVLIHGTKAQQKKMWKRLNEAKDDLAWIKMKIITDAFRSMDAKRKEEFNLTIMEGYIKNGNYIQLPDDFVDEETGIKYRQYKRVDGLLHRVPYATEGMDKTTYRLAENKHFLGDCIEVHWSDGRSELEILDTPEKVKDRNDRRRL